MSDADSFRPTWVSSPGETILDVMTERGWSTRELAFRLEQSLDEVLALVQGRARVTIAQANRLQAVLGATVEFWMTRDFQYRDDVARQDAESQAWLSEVPLSDLVRFGWIAPAPSPADELDACLRFFGTPDVQSWRRLYGSMCSNVAFRTSKTIDSKPAAVIAWLRQGEIEAKNVQCAPWDRQHFVDSLADVRRLSKINDPKRFLPRLRTLCSSAGVAVSVVRAPAGCRASGAARFLSPKKALIQLSFRYLTDDQFWFTFFHEAGHLVLHSHISCHVEGLPAPSEALEAEANEFAVEHLVPAGVRRLLAIERPSGQMVLKLAHAAGVSPGIIVGQLQFAGRLKQNQLNGLKRRFAWEDKGAAIREKG